MMSLFYCAFIESILTFSLASWFVNLSLKNKNPLKKIVKWSSKLIGEPQPNIEALYTKQLQRKSQSIQSDNTHPLSSPASLKTEAQSSPKQNKPLQEQFCSCIIFLHYTERRAEREVMFPEAPLGIGKNYLIHRSDLLYLILLTVYGLFPSSSIARFNNTFWHFLLPDQSAEKTLDFPIANMPLYSDISGTETGKCTDCAKLKQPD
jgi:hypothetical protein